MALTTYNGPPGSGKSYEVVMSVVIPAIKAGRRVLTNIDGMNSDAIREYCVSEYGSVLEELGSVVIVKETQIRDKNFFPHVLNNEIVPGDYIVSPGDIVCVDEGYKFWKNRLLEPHLVFFREHRHLADPVTGYTCDIVIMTQTFGDLHRDVRAIVEQSYLTHKAKAIKDNLYTISQFDGNRQVKATFVQDWTRTYNPKIFPLYKSYFGGAGKEGSVDARQKFVTKKVVYKVVIFALIAAYVVYRFAHALYQKTYVDPMEADKARHGGASSLVRPVGQPGVSAVPGSPDLKVGGISSEWRIVGSMVVGGRRNVVLSNSSGRLRLEPTDCFTGEGAAEVGSVDGLKVSRFSGQIPVGSVGGVKP